MNIGGIEFEQVGTLEAGELVFPLPGLNIKLKFESGKLFLSEKWYRACISCHT